MRRYGVFKLGQIWSVVGDDGMMRGFPTRHKALAAADDLLEEQRAYGAQGEAVVQDDAGRLITTAAPAQLIDVTGAPRDTIWDRAFGGRTKAPTSR